MRRRKLVKEIEENAGRIKMEAAAKYPQSETHVGDWNCVLDDRSLVSRESGGEDEGNPRPLQL